MIYLLTKENLKSVIINIRSTQEHHFWISIYTHIAAPSPAAGAYLLKFWTTTLQHGTFDISKPAAIQSDKPDGNSREDRKS